MAPAIVAGGGFSGDGFRCHRRRFCRVFVRERHVEARESDIRFGGGRVDVLLTERIVIGIAQCGRFVVDGTPLQYGNFDRILAVEIHHRNGPRLGQCLADGGIDDLPHGLLVGEMDFGLVRMDVDVDAPGVDRQIEKERGLHTLGYQLLVGFQQGARQIIAFEETAIDEEKLLGSRAAFGCRRASDESLDRSDRCIGRNLQEILFDVAPHDIDDAFGERSGGQRIDGCIVGVEFECRFGIAKGDPLEFVLDLFRGCRYARFEPPAASRNIVEKVADEELRSDGTHDRFLRNEFAAVEGRYRAQFVLLLAGAQLDLRHGGDGSERLAAETERMEFVDVVRRDDFARCVAVESHAGVDGRHAASVVDDLDQLQTAVAVVDPHAARTCVERIFHHLLDH